MNKYLVLAYYKLMKIENPHEEVETHKEFLKDKNITCRVYISEQGINGQLSGTETDAKAYIDWMHSREEFSDTWFKIQEHHENVFPRATVKYRKQLVALDMPFDIDQRGESISPEQWKSMFEKCPDRVVLDIRNDYEWALGHFEGADLPPCSTFREFNGYAEKLKETVDPKKTSVMMYCTGGIRCELFSSVLKEQGFEKVYQLYGGLLNYADKEGAAKWLGKLFVFDDRLAVPMAKKDEQAEVIGKCWHCNESNENYYNCANMDCNRLFLCCSKCLEDFAGCCHKDCQIAERVRPYQHCTHKPFRKWYHYAESGIKKKKS